MGRRPRQAGLPYEDEARIQEHVKALAPGHLPEDVRLCRRIIEALEYRFKKISRHEYMHVSGAITTISKLEAMTNDDLPAVDRANAVMRELLSIAKARASTLPHQPLVLSIQRSWVLDLLTVHRYPARKDTSNRERWIKEQWPELVKRVTEIPCLCTYETDFAECQRRMKRDGLPLTIAPTADFIIAVIHGSLSLETARKYARRPA
jgi:hypothetical protein